MHQARMIRSMVTQRIQLPAPVLAPSRLVLGHGSFPPIPQRQQPRSMATTLGGAVVGTVSWAVVLAPFVLIARSLRRKQISKQLRITLDQACQLQDEEKRRQVFFDVARHHARNNGSRVDLKDTFNREISVLEEGASACSLKTIGPHNSRYSIQRSKLGKWRLWVAVDAEFDVRPNSDTAISSPESIRTDNESENRKVTLVIAAVLHLMRQKLAAAIKATGEQAEGGSHIGVTEESDVELLFWDTIISLKVRTLRCNMRSRTYWVEKIGEKQPSRFEWFIIHLHRHPRGYKTCDLISHRMRKDHD